MNLRPSMTIRRFEPALLPAQTGGITANFLRLGGAGRGRAKTRIRRAGESPLAKFLQFFTPPYDENQNAMKASTATM